ncbi:PepSY domain-containing protein [Sphingomonas lutea]|uniref:PepSY domain-containing protein n=1 Tax=Sphingomonas lutea TaxID=1045317 RepID=A0A7G9SHF4_9SPHN|nr:PepSY domain-containing protein [Sphingomonas lutea]QNN67279.1 PepSY domain-containing protein [Sphingomonas lutea]
MGAVRSRLRRWHIWLGWIVGIPFLVWTVSGLIMVWKPIEEVRGTHLLADPKPMRMTGLAVPPVVAGLPIAALKLEPRAAGPRWVLGLPDGTTRLADPQSGALLPPLSAADAVREVGARYTGEAKVAAVTRIDPARPPVDFRRDMAAWQVRMDDGTHFYVDPGSGEVVARRTAWWRFYDFMWGLHIMDPQTREDTHNPWVIGFGIVSLVTTLLALIMLPMTIRRRRKAARNAA